MTLRHRGTLTLVTLLMLAGAALGGGAWLVTSKADPETASRAQILRYLVLGDVAAEPLAVQEAWVDRLEVELTSDFAESGQASTSLSAPYRERLARNIDTLQTVWFRTRTAQYAALPEGEREAFLVRQLAIVGSFAKIGSLLETEPVPLDVATRKLMQRIDQWVHASGGAPRDAMTLAIKDATLCWLSTTDLSAQPIEVKRDLAVRLAKELDKGSKPNFGGLVTDEGRRAQLVSNAGELVEAYVYELSDRFTPLSRTERLQFIDDKLAAIERWGIQDLLSSNVSASMPPSRASAALAFAERSQAWIDHAPDDQRENVQAFVTALQQRLVWKQLPGWLRR